jgi:hypothetical protein
MLLLSIEYGILIFEPFFVFFMFFHISLFSTFHFRALIFHINPSISLVIYDVPQLTKRGGERCEVQEESKRDGSRADWIRIPSTQLQQSGTAEPQTAGKSWLLKKQSYGFRVERAKIHEIFCIKRNIRNIQSLWSGELNYTTLMSETIKTERLGV